jgi:DNA-binding NtrC family response regulator
MNRLIAQSASSKESLNLAKMATELRTNILIVGETGTGKKLLCKEINSECETYDIVQIEQILKEKTFTNQKDIIIYNIDLAKSFDYLMKILTKNNIRIIATASNYNKLYKEYFLVKINTIPLRERIEDLTYLKTHYLKEAKRIFTVENEITLESIELDLSKNGISLKASIYKYVALNSFDNRQIADMVERYYINYFKSHLDAESEEDSKRYFDYKDLLAVYETALLKAAKQIFKSQLKISNMLNLNRITLRKKLSLYGLD